MKQNKYKYICYTKEGEYKASFTTIKDAASNTKADIATISKCINGKAHTAGGLIWKRELQKYDSKYYGVKMIGGVWKAYITKYKSQHQDIIGYFFSELDAAFAFDCYCVNKCLNVILNFPLNKQSYLDEPEKYFKNKIRLRKRNG